MRFRHIGRRFARPESAADPAEIAEVERMLRPAQSQSEGQRMMVRARLMRPAVEAVSRENAGSRDGVDDAAVNTQVVGHPIGTVALADIETITPHRAAEVAERLAALVERAHGEKR